MSKVRLLTYIVVALLVLNLGLIAGFLFFSQGPMKHMVRNKENLQRMFDFDENQMASFEKFREKHMNKMKPLREELRKESEEYYKTIGSQDSVSQEDILLSISKTNEAIYKLNHEHFTDVASICTDGQLENLTKFIGHLLRPGGPPPGRKPKN